MSTWEQTKRGRRLLSIWIATILIAIMMTVVVGGITRLTNSGLSITEWRPIIGAIPPLNEVQWSEAFEKYKLIPEYEIEHSYMGMDEFKRIYFWEWLHRNLGRFIGFIFIIPFVLLGYRLSRALKKKLFLGFCLGGTQALMGWLMVVSGLSERTDVSHYLLAAHLILAFFIFSYFLRTLIDLNLTVEQKKSYEVSKSFRWALVAVHSLLGLQIIYGAFVAGLRAGFMYNTFPKMGDSLIPYESMFYPTLLLSALENPVTVQFIHRWMGALLLLSCLALVYFSYKSSVSKKSKILIWSFFGLILTQFSLGVLTLVSKMQIELASLHQFFGLLSYAHMSFCMYVYKCKEDPIALQYNEFNGSKQLGQLHSACYHETMF